MISSGTLINMADGARMVRINVNCPKKASLEIQQHRLGGDSKLILNIARTVAVKYSA